MKYISVRSPLFAILLISLLISGCQTALLSSATQDPIEKIYNDMKTINDAIVKYKTDHGTLPEGDRWEARASLFFSGYINPFPTPPPSVFSAKLMDYGFNPQYDTMDSGPAPDAAIYLWGLKDDVCREYNRRYASDDSGPTIYDWEAHDRKYPGETIGQTMTTYAIKFKSDVVDDCEINWVVEYR